MAQVVIRPAAEMPGLGVRRGEVRGGYRSIQEARHLIFYREIEEGIEVVRVLHEGMDLGYHLSGLSADLGRDSKP